MKATPIHKQPLKADKLFREEELLIELQRDHGYMFLPATKEMERSLMHCVVNKKTRKAVLTASRVARVSVPDGSWLGKQIVTSLKKAEVKNLKGKTAKKRKGTTRMTVPSRRPHDLRS